MTSQSPQDPGKPEKPDGAPTPPPAGINRPRNPSPALSRFNAAAPLSAHFTAPMGESLGSGFVQGVNEHMVLLVTVLVSLVIHSGIAFALYNRALGAVDPAQLNDAEGVYLVQRADADLIEEPPGTADAPEGTGPQASAEVMDLSDLSLAMLNTNSRPDSREGLPMPAPVVELRKVPEHPDEGLAGPVGQKQTGLPPVALPDTVMDVLKGRATFDMPFKDSPSGLGGSGAETFGPGVGEGGTGDAPTALATQLLSRGGIDVGGNPQPTALQRPRFSDTGPGSGFSPAAAAGPPIDFAGLALRDTTKLPIPEHLDNDFDYGVAKFEPRKPIDEHRGYFRVDITGKRSLRKLKSMPKDVVFLIDTSGSIPQEWVAAVMSGVRDALGSLNEGDRFNIVLFNDKPAFFSTQGVQPFNEQTIPKAQSFLTTAQSGGDTDVNQALTRLLVRDVATERVYDLILISDGVPTKGVMDTRELINLITRDNDLSASIYCVGVGTRQNHELLDFLSYRNKGLSVYASTIEQAPGVVRDLLGRLRYPIMKDIRMAAVGIDGRTLFPRDLPNIHQGETFSIFGRYDNPDKFTMRLTGHNGAQLFDFTFTRDLREADEGTKDVSTGWAFNRLHFLYSEVLRKGLSEEIKKEMDRLRKEYGLKTLY